MSCSSIFLRKASRTFPSLLTFHRYMGGGPRTFPGGLNKWQWKRLHEKKAQEKEKRLLDQEKQLYQARIRSQIRAKLAAAGELQPTSAGPPQPGENKQHTHGPLSPEEQIKALADRFMKEGAEDLWNEDDGPVKSPSAKPAKNGIIGEPIDIRKLVTENLDNNVNWLGSLNNLSNFSKPRHFSTSVIRSEMDIMCGYNSIISMNFGNVMKSRYYSVHTRSKVRSKRLNFTRNESSESEDGSDSDEELVGPSGRRTRYPRFGASESRLSDDDDDDKDSDSHDEDEDVGKRGKVKRMMSSAALGKYDMKTTKRVPLKFLEDEDDLSRHVEAIRKEVNKRSLMVEEQEESFLSSKRFDECDISPLTVKALTASGYVQMTRVQEATLSACLEGNDVLVKAKTGTGKSAAFLLPAIETVLKASNSNKKQRVPPVYVLIICPTRELASQIAAEANVLLKYNDGIGVQTLIGGTRFKVDQKRLESDPSQIIVATPGRLLDHIENKSGFSVRLMGLKMLILDEADHLLDLGFRKDIEKILDCLPRQRQSLLFSATIPKEVRRVSQLVLKREHAYIDTVGLSGLETSIKVKQSYLVAPHEEHFQIVHHLLENHISQVADYKVIIFCTTAMMTSLMSSLYREMKLNVREIHSRKPQIARTRISDEFKASKRLILISSDVSARGMNYPDVTLVVQVGIPPDREQYIHRLGRTGREGKDGEGILVLAPWEEYFLVEIKDLPLEKCPLPRVDTNAKAKLQDSMSKIDSSVKEATYHAWLGFYNSIREIGRDKTTLVELADRFSESIGLQKPPALFRRTASKMGLKDIPGIRIRK